MVRAVPEKTGQLSLAESQTVITKSMGKSLKSSTCFEVWCEISTPTSFITFMAKGLSECGLVPAENAWRESDFRCRVQPSAIWLRHELPVQRKRTRLSFDLAAVTTAPSPFHRRFAAAANGFGKIRKYLTQIFVANFVKDRAALFLRFKNADIGKQGEMPGDDREIHGATFGDLRGRTGPSASSQTTQEFEPGWIAKRFKDLWIQQLIEH